MILRDIVGNYQINKIIGDLDVEITGINHDSRKIIHGNVFVALKGFTVDGHKFIGEAIGNGAIALVVEEYGDPMDNITTILVNDTTDALGHLSNNYYNDPSNSLKVIGITGTNGKTSTSYFLKGILEKNDEKIAMMGTIGVVIDNIYTKLANTTPDSLVIHDNLRKMADCGSKYCIMEVSSHALDLKRVDNITFDSAIFTNLSRDHLDYHKTMENYFSSKIKLFCKSNKSNIINIDDEYGKRILNILTDENKIITYGIKEKANIYATDIEHELKATKFILHTPDDKVEVYLNIPGEFNIYNALAAASYAYTASIDIKTIKSGLESVMGIRGRLEIIKTEADFTIIIDFSHTPDGLEKVLGTIRSLTLGRVIVVFGAGGNRDKTKRPQMGQVVGNNSDIAIITSDNPRSEDPLEIIKDIEIGIKTTQNNYITIVNRKKAIEYAIKIAKINDIILLAGKGHEVYTIIGAKQYPFDERQLVLDIISKI